jgi:DNA recombination protein RmuC
MATELSITLLIAVAVTVVVAALIGALIGAWIANRRSPIDPQITDGFRDLTTFSEQSARTIRENVETLRGAVADAERAFGSTLRDSLVAVSNNLTSLRTEITAAFEAASAKAKLDAADTNKALSSEIATSLQKHSTDQGTKIDAFSKKTEERLDAFSTKLESSGAAVAKSVADFQTAVSERMGDVKTTVMQFGGNMTTALAENQTKTAKALTDEFTKLTTQVDTKVTEMRTGNDAFSKKTEERLDTFSTKLETSGAAVAKSIADFQTAVSERMGEVRMTVTEFGGNMTTTLAENQTKTAKALTDELAKLTTQVDTKITEMRTGNEEKLLAIQGVVDQKLQEGIEKKMTESFAKITTQFAEVQQAVGEVKTVAGQVGDLKRLFSNVKSRGGWGEAQVKATLDDILPANSYEMNKCVNPATTDTVEFALKMPVQGGAPVYLAIDAKFPMEDYSRLIDAVDAADISAERSARSGLEVRIRAEAKKIQAKYIAPPHTVEWAILYLPSEGLYSEVTRNGDLMEAIQREFRVMIAGPSLLAVMLRTIQLGHYTLAISQKADLIGQILGAVKHEMVDFGNQFRLLERNVQALGNNIKRGHTRARVITRRLKGIEALEGPAAAEILELTAEGDDPIEEVEDDEATAAE